MLVLLGAGEGSSGQIKELQFSLGGSSKPLKVLKQKREVVLFCVPKAAGGRWIREEPDRKQKTGCVVSFSFCLGQMDGTGRMGKST